MQQIRKIGQGINHIAESPGLWIGVTVISLASSLAMVQIRCRLFSGYPCGDWPNHGYTWHFWPPFLFMLLVWVVAARAWSRQGQQSLVKGLDAHGKASSPALGLVVAWGWYGLTGPQFHAPACTTPVLCHDVLPLGILIWSAPWIVWGAWQILALWRRPLS